MRALILVDIQNDFVPGGALAVPEGDLVVPIANELSERFDVVVATQDWHPANHGSFASNHDGRNAGEVTELDGLSQVLWPDHCIQGGAGAEFVDALNVERIDKVFRKGTDPAIDSYSGFYDNGHRKATGLADYLRERGVDDVVIVGLAADYCVKWTALDARREGFGATVLTDAVRGVELNEGDVEAAFAEMRAAGVRLAESGAVL